MRLFPILLLFAAAHCQENSTSLCQRCRCVSTADAQVLTIDCKNQNVDHTVSTWPPHNATLRAIFAGNNITSLDPFPATNATLELVLTGCRIKYLSDGLFVKTRNVTFLDLSHNLLAKEEIASDRFRGPFSNNAFEPIALQHLNLSYNQIHSLAANIFEHMPNLRHLDLEGNDFKVLDVPTQIALASVQGLQSLNLANNELTELVSNAIRNHPNLTELNLARNQLDFVPDSLPEVGQSLQVLVLDGNPILELTQQSLVGLTGVEDLSLNSLPKLRYVNANTFVPVRQLRRLSLSDNVMLKDIDREAFAVNQTLEEFYLNDNILYRIDYKLLRWAGLRVFEFRENPLDCSCDLYNITRALARDITKVENGPYCTDPRNGRPVQVYALKSDICRVKGRATAQMEFIQYHFSMIRIALITLSVILMVVAFVAAILGYIRYRKYKRNISYPYASQVMYNPLSTNSRF